MTVDSKAVLALTGASFWPFLHLASHNKNQLDWQGFVLLVLIPTILLGLVIPAAYALRRLLAIAVAPLAISLAVAILLFFNYQTILESLLRFGLPKVNYLYLVAGVALPLLAYRFARNRVACDAALIFAATLVALPGIDLGVYAFDRPNGPFIGRDTRAPGVLAPLERRNVYYIITDAYARHDELAKLGFDNRPLLDFLGEHGFYVAEQARANYPITVLSLTSSLAGDYPIRHGDKFFERKAFHEIIRGQNPIVERFRSNGFKYVHGEASVWIVSDCAGFEDFCIRTQRQPFGSSELTSVIVGMTPVSYFWRPEFRPPPPPLDFSASSLERIREATDAPLFAFVHVFTPHPPWNYDAQCEPRSDIVFSWFEPRAKSLYLDAVRCVNAQIKRFVTQIEATDPDALVVIQSDHGSGFKIDWSKKDQRWSEAMFAERFGVLMSIRSPEKCRKWLYPSISPVNVFEFVFSCLSSRPPQYDPDVSFIVDTGGTEAKPTFVRQYGGPAL